MARDLWTKQSTNDPTLELPIIQHWTSKKFKNRLDNEIENGGFGKGDLAEIAYPITHRHVGELFGMGEEGNGGHGREDEVDINKVNEWETANADVERKDVEYEHVEAMDVAAKDENGVEKRH